MVTSPPPVTSSGQVLIENETLASFLASSEWNRFLKAASRDAATIEKLRHGAMSSWVARQHSAAWFARVRAAKSFPQKDKSKLLSFAEKKGGTLLKCLLIVVWNVSDTRLKWEKWANSCEERIGISGTTLERMHERQETAIWDPAFCALCSLSLSGLACNIFGFGPNIGLVLSLCFFVFWTITRQQRVAHSLAPLKFSSGVMRESKCEQPKGGVARTTRRELEKEQGKALRAKRQRERRAISAAAKEEIKPAAQCLEASDGVCSEENSPSSSSQSNSNSPESDVVSMGEADDGLCVCCLSNEALFVVSHCGHCVFCRGCRRKMVHDTLLHSSGQAAIDRHDLRNRELTRTKVACPLCRSEGFIIEKSQYDGTVILP